MAKLLITGGAGFQGRFLVQHFLSKGHEITILNTYSDRADQIIKEFNKNINIVWGSITDYELVYKTVRNHDCVFHLAARINVDESIKDPRAALEVNLLGTYNILEAVRLSKSRLIYASSCEVYGESVYNEPINEDTELRPHSPYAASKAAADRLCFSYYKTYGINLTIVRPFNIYGPFQKKGEGGAVIPIFVYLAMQGRPLTVYGKGNQKRDYLYVTDLVQAYDIVYHHDKLKGEVINFGTGEEVKIIDIAKYIAEKFQVEIKFKKNRPGEVHYFKADSSKAIKLGFQPTINIWTGIDKYISWYKKYNNL